MRLAHRFTVFVAALLLSIFGAAVARTAERTVVGYIERVRVFPGDLVFSAKIDTGAKTTSIDFETLVPFQRDDEEWVRFTSVNRKGKKITVERPVIRIARIRQLGTSSQERYVVNLGICMGGYFKEAEVNLSEREGMNYTMLIGRRFLAGRFLVDASAKKLTKPNCTEVSDE